MPATAEYLVLQAVEGGLEEEKQVHSQLLSRATALLSVAAARAPRLAGQKEQMARTPQSIRQLFQLAEAAAPDTPQTALMEAREEEAEMAMPLAQA